MRNDCEDARREEMSASGNAACQKRATTASDDRFALSLREMLRAPFQGFL